MPSKEYYYQYALNLPPEEAIKYLKSKGFKITWAWQEQLELNNAHVFTVAKAMQMDILQDIRNMLIKSLKDGMPFSEFKNQLEPKLKAAGWWGWEVVDGKRVQLGSPHRLKTIYRTNMSSSFNAGRWKHFEENKDSRPYLEYVAVMDPSTRDEHAALNGEIHPVGSSFWNTYAPPNGYNCRCRLRSLSMLQAKRAGGSTKTPPGIKPHEAFRTNTGKKQWKPRKKDYDADIWNTVQS